jgi:membrane-associated protein
MAPVACASGQCVLFSAAAGLRDFGCGGLLSGLAPPAGRLSWLSSMELIRKLIDFILHIDGHLREIVANYGLWTYAVLFLIVFAETGLVVTPFLPGDSLLFAAGALCAPAESQLNVHLIALVLFLAAVLGDTVNYWVGARLGPAVFKREDSFLLRKKHLDRAHEFFLRYGGRAIVLARFVPIVRTFVPFVAGVGRMPYGRFIAYNVAGGFVWVYFFTYAGYFFGTHPVVQRNFKLVILAIIVLSVLPIVVEFWRSWRTRSSRTEDSASG